MAGSLHNYLLLLRQVSARNKINTHVIRGVSKNKKNAPLFEVYHGIIQQLKVVEERDFLGGSSIRDLIDPFLLVTSAVVFADPPYSTRFLTILLK